MAFLRLLGWTGFLIGNGFMLYGCQADTMAQSDIYGLGTVVVGVSVLVFRAANSIERRDGRRTAAARALAVEAEEQRRARLAKEAAERTRAPERPTPGAGDTGEDGLRA
ncbi:hypothetical protein GCM10009760_40890 [Kitasatospora kazusensis]|uniref:Uncharacterized protein n=1 Tax=Kitasatospora kazusensis TaxID=407974 RepID=A0ABP5LJT4_9ACTN